MAIKDTRIFFEIKEKKYRTSVRAIPEFEQVQEDWESPCFLFLDQSTSTGYALYDNKNQLILSGLAIKGNTGLMDYKYQLKDIVYDLIEKYGVKTVFHEEVYDKDNMWTTEVLMYIKHMIKDIEYHLSDVEVFGVDHMTWKTKLAGKDKFNTQNNHKQEAKKYVAGVYPLLFMDVRYGELTEDMIDAIGMGVALLVKQTRRGDFYHTVRYNKSLPIHVRVVTVEDYLDDEGDVDWEARIAKCQKPYREGYEIGGDMELELDKRRAVGDLFRRFLSHRDGVAVVRVPYTYKDWGVLLLEYGMKPSELPESKEFWLMAVRRNRK